MTTDSKDDALKRWKTRGFKTWTIIGVVLILLGLITLCGILKDAVFAIIIAALIVFFLHAIVSFLENKGIPRIWGATISMVGAFIVIVGGMSFIIPAMVSQGMTLIDMAPSYAAQLQNIAKDILNNTSYLPKEDIYSAINSGKDLLIGQAGNMVSAMATGVMGGISGVGSLLIDLLIAILAAFWMLIDLPKITRELRSLFRPEQQESIDLISSSFGKAIYGWAKATLICALMNGIATGIILSIFGVPYATILAVIAAIAYIIPYVGNILSGVLIALVALTVSPWVCIFAVVTFLIVVNVIGNVVSPALMKQSVNVHPALILICLLIGSGLGGPVGMLAAVPIAAAAQSIFVSYFEAYRGTNLYSKDGALFYDLAEDIPKKRSKLVKKIRGITSNNTDSEKKEDD